MSVLNKKIFHAEIVVDNAKVSAETKLFKEIPPILSFADNDGIDNMKQEIKDNYNKIKQDVIEIINQEMERIKMTLTCSIWFKPNKLIYNVSRSKIWDRNRIFYFITKNIPTIEVMFTVIKFLANSSSRETSPNNF